MADDERFTTNAGRVENRKLLDEAIAAWCAQHDLQHVQEVADALRGVDVPVLIKNPINPDLELWMGAVERVAKAGIKPV